MTHMHFRNTLAQQSPKVFFFIKPTNKKRWNSSAHRIWLFKLGTLKYPFAWKRERIYWNHYRSQVPRWNENDNITATESVGVSIVDPRFQISHGQFIQILPDLHECLTLCAYIQPSVYPYLTTMLYCIYSGSGYFAIWHCIL